MVLNKFRHISDKLIKSQVEYLARKKVSPNTISFVGFGLMVCAAVGFAFPSIFIYNPFLSWIPVLLFFLSGYVDVLDGGVARATGTDSKYGGFLDSTLDRLSDAVIIIGFMLGDLIWPWNQNINNIVGFLTLSFIFLISYTRTRAENEGVVMKGIGFMERAERVFIIVGGYLIEANIYFWSEWIPPQITYLGDTGRGWFFPIFFLIFAILCLDTFISRVIHAKRWLTGTISEEFLIKHNLQDQYNRNSL